jgi:hypothetical protein
MRPFKANGSRMIPKGGEPMRLSWQTRLFTLQSSRSVLASFQRLVPICQRLHKGNKSILFGIAKSQMADRFCIHVRGCFWGRPTCSFLTSIPWLASRKRVPCIVEVNDLLETLEIAVVAISLDELRVWPLVDVSQCRDLDTAIVFSSMLDPVCVGDRWTAQEVLVLKKCANAEIDVSGSVLIGRIAREIRMILLIKGD